MKRLLILTAIFSVAVTAAYGQDVTKATVKLEPGGLHVMMHDLKRPLTVGEKVPLVIQLSGGGTVQATATVRPLSAE